MEYDDKWTLVSWAVIALVFISFVVVCVIRFVPDLPIAKRYVGFGNIALHMKRPSGELMESVPLSLFETTSRKLSLILPIPGNFNGSLQAIEKSKAILSKIEEKDKEFTWELIPISSKADTFSYTVELAKTGTMIVGASLMAHGDLIAVADPEFLLRDDADSQIRSVLSSIQKSSDLLCLYCGNSNAGKQFSAVSKWSGINYPPGKEFILLSRKCAQIVVSNLRSEGECSWLEMVLVSKKIRASIVQSGSLIGKPAGMREVFGSALCSVLYYLKYFRVGKKKTGKAQRKINFA